jgi:hypothetical protein
VRGGGVGLVDEQGHDGPAATKMTVENDFQNHRLRRCRDPDFSLRAFTLFFDERRGSTKVLGNSKAGRLSSHNISIPYCMRIAFTQPS